MIVFVLPLFHRLLQCDEGKLGCFRDTVGLFLNCSAKALYMSIVIGAMQAGVSGSNSSSTHLLFKVASKFWAVIGLNHGDTKTPFTLCRQYSLSRQFRSKFCCQDDVSHPSKQVYDRVVIQPPATVWIDVMDGICLD